MLLPKTRPWVLPNRAAFADFITRTFLKYYHKVEEEFGDLIDKDPCYARREGAYMQLLPYQQLVRDFMLDETPYDGVYVYHGLGSGKSFTSIGIALSLMENRHIYVMLPASLHKNFEKEFLANGKPLYAYENHWTYHDFADSPDARRQALEMLHLSEEFVAGVPGVWLTAPNKEPNYDGLSAADKGAIDAQILNILSTRFTFIHYNDSTLGRRLPEMLDMDSEGNIRHNIFNHAAVIIDEAHQLVQKFLAHDGGEEGEGRQLEPLYRALLTATDCKKIALGGTPIVNEPYELAYAFNMLRGQMTAFYLPPPASLSFADSTSPGTPAEMLRSIPDVDLIEYISPRRRWMVTRNPQYFVTVKSGGSSGGDGGDGGGTVRYDPKQNRADTDEAWLVGLCAKLQAKGWQVTPNEVQTQSYTALPTNRREFMEAYVDTARMVPRNPNLFMRRIQGLVSFFKGVDMRMLPEELERDRSIVFLEMTRFQYLQYQKARVQEIRMDTRKARFRSLDSDMPSTYRSETRQICNYAVPAELKEVAREADAGGAWKADVLKALRARADEYFSAEKLRTMYSPKFAVILDSIENGTGLHLVYSAFRNAEGVGFFAEALRYAGYREMSVAKTPTGVWTLRLDNSKKNKPYFCMFTSEETPEEREICRLIYINDMAALARSYPGVYSALTAAYGEAPDNLRGEILKVFLITAAGATGIDLKNVRYVHIMEPYWNPSLMDQVKGRAIRVCSHAALPPEERNVRVFYYIMKFGADIYNPSENNAALIRTTDTINKGFMRELAGASASDGGQAGPAPTEPATTDEVIYQIAYEKRVLSDQFTALLKQAAVDCEIHKPMHRRNNEAAHCMRFDVGEDVAFHPDWHQDVSDETAAMNKDTRPTRLQKIRVRGFVFLLRPGTGELYNWDIWEQSRRLIHIGQLSGQHVSLLA